MGRPHKMQVVCWLLAEAVGGAGRRETQDPEKRDPEACDVQEELVAATSPDNHVSVFLQDDVGAVIEVEHGDGIELSRSTARLGHRFRVDEMYLEHTRKQWWW